MITLGTDAQMPFGENHVAQWANVDKLLSPDMNWLELLHMPCPMYTYFDIQTTTLFQTRQILFFFFKKKKRTATQDKIAHTTRMAEAVSCIILFNKSQHNQTKEKESTTNATYCKANKPDGISKQRIKQF